MSSAPVQPTNAGPAGRPLGLAAIAGLDLAIGALGAAGGVAAFGVADRVLAYAGASLSAQTLGLVHVLVPILATALIGLGGFSIALGWGLWRGARWAWAIAVAAELVHVLADLGSLATRGLSADKLVGLAIILAITYYLTRPNVRAYFGLGGTRR